MSETTTPGHDLLPATPVRFEFCRARGTTPIVLEADLEEFIPREDLGEMTLEEVQNVIAEAHGEWLLEQVLDGACWSIGEDQ